MTDTNADDETDALTLTEIFASVETQLEREDAEVEDEWGDDVDVSPMADSELVSAAAEINELLKAVEVAISLESQDEDSETSPSEIRENAAAELEDAVVDLLIGVGVLNTEYDELDIEDAVAERITLMEDYAALEDAIENAETEEEQRAAVDEHMGDELEAMMMGDMGIDVGENVDNPDYDHGDVGKGFQ